MRKYNARIMQLCFALLLVVVGGSAIAQEPPPQAPPASVAGNWTIYAKDPDGGTSTKFIRLNQNGSVLTGHFKGPHQSSGLEGTINEQHIVFKTTGRYVLTFRGRVDGPRAEGVVQGTSIQGTFHTRAGQGHWQAVRSN